MPQNGTDEMNDDDKDKELKLAQITPSKKMKHKEETLTSNSFTITKHLNALHEKRRYQKWREKTPIL